MTKDFKPLLSATLEDTATLAYPVFASTKLDGIRVVIIDSVVYSRSLKMIRSQVVQELFGKPELNGLDCEVLYGDWTAKNVFNVTTQTVMATELKPQFTKNELRLAVFDYVDSDEGYSKRYAMARSIVESVNNPQIKLVEQKLIYSEQDLLDFETETLEAGYEGLMIRSLGGAYKQGRSTLKDSIISKLKRFSQDEAIIIGFEELMHNTNEKTTNELGRSQRSQAQDGLVGMNTLGALIVRDLKTGIEFKIGTGYDAETRQRIWDNREAMLGKIVTYKHFKIGVVDAPRFPVYISERDPDDL
jgi:DNA ligase-1